MRRFFFSGLLILLWLLATEYSPAASLKCYYGEAQQSFASRSVFTPSLSNQSLYSRASDSIDCSVREQGNHLFYDYDSPTGSVLGNIAGNHFSRYDSATGVWDYVVQNPWSKFDPDGLKFKRGKNISNKDWKTFTNARKKIRESDYYDGSDFQKVDTSEDYVVTVNSVEDSAKGVKAKTRFKFMEEADGTRSGELYINFKKDHKRLVRGKNGKLTKQKMSLDSILVHEGKHASDWNESPENYEGVWKDFFRQTPEQMKNYPNELEKRAVDEANLYRKSIGKPLREVYTDSPGVMRYWGIDPQSGSVSDLNRNERFDRGRRSYERRNVNPKNHFDPYKFNANKFLQGKWPPKP